MAFDKDLPDEIAQEAQPRSQEMDNALLEALGLAIAAKRTEAVEARKVSGIEAVWMACEEAYLGIDDANRHEFAGAQWFKPAAMNGNLTQLVARNNTRSTAFVRLTSRYVDMGAAKISEITLPIDDKAFSLAPTPVPDLISKVDDKTPLTVHPVTGEQGQVMRDPVGDEQPGPDGKVPATVGDLAKATMDQAKDSAEKAEKRIYDWMVESRYPLEMRKVEHDAARIGVGILKCPYAQTKTSWVRESGKLRKKTKIAPGMRSISPWNFYPHGSCGENIHDGDYVFECDDIATAKLKRLKDERTSTGAQIYIASQIDRVIEEGPDKCNLDSGNPNRKKGDKKSAQYKIWYFTGVISRKDMALMGAAGLDDLPDDVTDVNAIVTMVNDAVIMAIVNPLQSGGFPYRTHSWSRRDGSWAGVGVGEQVSMPQRTVNAATRALLNNAGITAGGQIVVDRSQIEPADGSWVIVPNKVWWTRNDATGTDDIRKAFMSFDFPNMGAQLQAVIEYGFRLAEEASNIPLVVQGKQQDGTPQTFGQAEMDNSNAHTLLRSIAYGLDDNITEPVVHDLYEWLLLDEDVPEDEKGDWVINAKGSIAMVERAIQEQVLAQMLPLSKDPAFGWNPKKLAARFLKAKRIDPREVEYTEEEMAQMAKQPPPEAPAVIVAKVRAESAEKIAAGRDQVAVRKSELDVDRDRAYEDALNQRAVIQQEGKTQELELRRELEVFKENNSMRKELDKLKTELAIAAAELKAQRELAVMSNRAAQVKETSMEPVGRADPGTAFQA